MCFEFTPVESSTIEAIGFFLSDQEMMDGELYIRFKNGSVFRYFQVPVHRHKALMESESKGKYYSGFIKKKYQGERVDKAQEYNDDVTDAHGIPIERQNKGEKMQIGVDMAKEGSDKTGYARHCQDCGATWELGGLHICGVGVVKPVKPRPPKVIRMGTMDL